MDAKYKKSLKLVTLLMTAALIATASAATYNYLFLNTAVGVEGADLAWANGTDGLTYVPAGATCSISGLKGPAGGLGEYSDAVRLVASATVTFDLSVDSVTGGVTGDTDQIESIYVILYDVDDPDTPIGTLTVWSGGVIGTTPITGLTMENTDQMSLGWEIRWKSTATGSETLNIVLKVTIP